MTIGVLKFLLSPIGVLFCQISGGFFCPAPITTAADTVLRNGAIYTLDASSTQAQALAIKDGRITQISTNEQIQLEVGDKTQVIDLQGHMAMPGLVDPHIHILAAAENLQHCSLNYQPLNVSQIVAHIQQCLDLDGNPDFGGLWLQVVDWDYPSAAISNGGDVTKLDLDRLNTTRPIAVRATDFHTLWVNSMALNLSGVTAATPDPQGGIVRRLPGGSEPSGILLDDARALIKAPPPTALEMLLGARMALTLRREAGVTTFQDAAADTPHALVFSALEEMGNLTARAYFEYWIKSPPNSSADIASIIGNAVDFAAEWNNPSPLAPASIPKWQAIKILIDGILAYTSNTAAMIDPYLEPVPGNNSAPWQPGAQVDTYWTPEDLAATVEQAFLNKLDVQIHSDGDLATRAWAHVQLVDPSDWPRFTELAVDPIVSFQWAQPSSAWYPDTIQSLGPVRFQWIEAWAKFASFGRPVMYGSDWPIDPLDEWLGLSTAVTRMGNPKSRNSPAFREPQFANATLPGDTLSREAALRAITNSGAGFLRAGADIGSLEVGKLADIIVLRDNYFTVTVQQIALQKVLLTMLGGEVLFVANGTDFGVTPKYPNDDPELVALEKRSFGGFEGRLLAPEDKKRIKRAHGSVCGGMHRH